MILSALRDINASPTGQLSPYFVSTSDSGSVHNSYSTSQSIRLPLLPLLSPPSLTEGLNTPSSQGVSARKTRLTSAEIKEIAIGLVGGLVATAAVMTAVAAFVYGGTVLGMNALPAPAFLALVFGVPSLMTLAVVEASLASVNWYLGRQAYPSPTLETARFIAAAARGVVYGAVD